MVFKIIPNGTGGRWAVGVIVLTHLIIYNEVGGTTTVFATIIAAFGAIFSAICSTAMRNVQIPYVRTSHRFDFLCLFLALWLDILALLAACGALARTLSTCLDTMTGGLARLWILGRNSPINEPWPDVLGVAVIFLVTGMFMLGLENTKVFSCLMISGVLGIAGLVSIVTWLQGTVAEWNRETLLPKGLIGLFTGSALCVFSYPREMPTLAKRNKIAGISVLFIVLVSNLLTAGCLSTIVKFVPDSEFLAVPILSVLKENQFTKIIPAVACLLVLACSGALLELFPEMYALIVQLTTSDWRILAKQIGYENRDSGSPVLAIFTGGSLCAMLAFACPLQNLIHILAASHLLAGIFRGFYLLYFPYRPKSASHQESSLAYSRLDSGGSPERATAASTSKAKKFWCFNKPIVSTGTQPPKKKSKSKLVKKQNNEELEREWLLLGEPPSPRGVDSQPDAESSILSDAEPQQPSDVECIAKIDSDSDSTDIDAIVDEYRQKVKVSTAGPMDASLRVPSTTSWRITIIAVLLLISSSISAAIGVALLNVTLLLSAIAALFMISILMLWIPKYVNPPPTPNSLTTGTSLLFGCVFFAGTLLNSWPAILFWFIAGLIFFIRCDTWCCLCLDRPIISHHQQLIPNVSSKLETIRVPRPPKGLLIPGRIPGHR